MFQTIFEKFSGLLDHRFILSVWAPSLFFWMALLGLVVWWAGPSVTLTGWAQLPAELQVVVATLLLVWVTFFARLLMNVLGTFVKLYEGYWEGFSFMRSFALGRRRYYADEIVRLRDDNSYEEIYFRFPPVTRLKEVMPTRLGNIMKNAELYPAQRYGMNSVLIWPRLYNVLPDHMVQNFASAAAELDLMLVISALGAAFACLGGLLAVLILPWYAMPLCVLLGALVAWLGYEGAVSSALPYSQLIKSAFDLHRGTLLKTMGWVPAKSYAKEKEQWRHISDLWFYGAPQGPEGVRALGYAVEEATGGGQRALYLKLKYNEGGVEGVCLLEPAAGRQQGDRDGQQTA